MTKQVQRQVEGYISDENKCLQDWYEGYYSSQFPGEPCSVLPDPGKIREAFDNWMKSKREQLFNLICVEWDYASKHNDTKFQDKVILASSLADFLIACTIAIPSPITTSVLLVRRGLEKLCKV